MIRALSHIANTGCLLWAGGTLPPLAYSCDSGDSRSGLINIQTCLSPRLPAKTKKRKKRGRELKRTRKHVQLNESAVAQGADRELRGWRVGCSCKTNRLPLVPQRLGRNEQKIKNPPQILRFFLLVSPHRRVQKPLPRFLPFTSHSCLCTGFLFRRVSGETLLSQKTPPCWFPCKQSSALPLEADVYPPLPLPLPPLPRGETHLHKPQGVQRTWTVQGEGKKERNGWE